MHLNPLSLFVAVPGRRSALYEKWVETLARGVSCLKR